MKLSFYGAAGEVTGSCHLIELGNKKIVLDCGLFQGKPVDEQRNREPFPFDPTEIDAVVLSHSHIDHSGRIPLLVKSGFTGPIYTQHASKDLCRIMLKDAGYLLEKDAEWENNKRQRKGLKPVEPLYTMDDATLALRRFKGLGYDETTEILPGVRVRLSDAGHILGASIVEVWMRQGSQQRKLVFSGDLGHGGAPIMRDPAIIHEADLVMLESTYGDRLHRSWDDTFRELCELFEAAYQDKGNILIPSFAVGRAQDLLYLFGKYHEEWGLDRWQIFLDSPMAIEATEVYSRHSQLYNRDANHLWQPHKKFSWLPNLTFSRTPNQSMQINKIRSGAIIIAGSGMCTGGRIKHHLKHNVWRNDCHIAMVGFQVQGTTGRALVDGARHIRLWGEAIKVEARVHTIGGLSAHADQQKLLDWYGEFKNKPTVCLLHGESMASQALSTKIRERFGSDVIVPQRGQSIDLVDLG